MILTGKVLKDMHGKVIAEQYESEVEKGKTGWIYKSTASSDFEFMAGCTIIAND